MIRVLLADDHVLVREGLRALLAKEADIQVVAEAGDGREAIRVARETRPDVAAMDLYNPWVSHLSETWTKITGQRYPHFPDDT